MKKQYCLSLANWPTSPLKQCKFNLSPHTAKILRKAKVKVISILPQSFEEFKVANNLFGTSNTQILDLHKEQIKRKKRKIQLLKQLWYESLEQKKKRKSVSSVKSSLSLKRQNLKSSRNLHKSRKSAKKQIGKRSVKKDTSPLMFKVSSGKIKPGNLDYYCLANQQEKLINNTENQSTRSRKRQELTKTGQYFQESTYKKRTTNKSNAKDKILLLINDVMKRWKQMDLRHQNQLHDYKDVQEHQKKRLLKIHTIEKEKLRAELDALKIDETVQRKLSRHFL